MNWPGSRCYPSQVLRSIQASGKFFVTARRSSSPQRNTKSFYCLQPTRVVCLHTAKSTRRYGEIFPLAVRATLSAFTSATFGKSCTRQLPMLPSTSDPSGKSDTALKYKQKNEMNSNQLPDCCSFHFSKFFLRLYSSGDSPNCFLKTAANFP